MESIAIRALALGGLEHGLVITQEEREKRKREDKEEKKSKRVRFDVDDPVKDSVAQATVEDANVDADTIMITDDEATTEEQTGDTDTTSDTSSTAPVDTEEKKKKEKRGRGRPRSDKTSHETDQEALALGGRPAELARKRLAQQKKHALIRDLDDLESPNWADIPSVKWTGIAKSKTRQSVYQVLSARLSEASTPALTANDISKTIKRVGKGSERGKLEALTALEKLLLGNAITGKTFDVHLINDTDKDNAEVVRDMLQAEGQRKLPLLALMGERKKDWGMQDVLDYWDNRENDAEPHGVDEQDAAQPLLVWDSEESTEKSSNRISSLTELLKLFEDGDGDPCYPANYLDIENNVPFKFLPDELKELDLMYIILKAEGKLDEAGKYRQKEFLLFSEAGAFSPIHRDKMGLCTAIWPATGDKTWFFPAAEDARQSDMAMCIKDFPTIVPHVQYRAVRLCDRNAVFIQPPGFSHGVHTNTNSMFAGLHFYSAASYHLSIQAIGDELFLHPATNDEYKLADWETAVEISKFLGDERVFSKREQSYNAVAAGDVLNRLGVAKKGWERKLGGEDVQNLVKAYLDNLQRFANSWWKEEEKWARYDVTKRRPNQGRAPKGKGFLDP